MSRGSGILDPLGAPVAKLDVPATPATSKSNTREAVINVTVVCHNRRLSAARNRALVVGSKFSSVFCRWL
jgi:hypothetical protein